MKHQPTGFWKFLAAAALSVGGTALWQSSALASANLSITPITWDIIGLDSNKVTVGPDTFMVGARVCNTGADPATNVVVNFNKLGANSYINLQYSNTLSIASLPTGSSTAIQTRPPNSYGSTPSNCSDFYYNLVITRDSAAYNTTLPYNITASADNATSVSTPTNRQLYIEKLVSQNRNSVASITGPTTVIVGQTYQYTVTGSTATGGYEQLVFSPNFPNVIFQVVGVSATYTSPGGQGNNSIYADGCGWTNDYTSSYYHNNSECTDSTITDGYSGGKVGNNVSTTYTVKILSAGSATITNLIYDFSGSSYHYNSDFGTGINTYTVTAVNPPDVTIAKSHTGSFIQGSTGTYNLNVSNVASTGSSATSGTVTVTDTLPTGLTPTAVTGTGWSCTISGQTVTCARSDALNPGASYPAIALSVAIATNASSSLTNTATVAGGSEMNTANDSASDPTTITPAPDLTIAKTHSGNFTQGQTGATYTLTAKNVGSAASTGTVTVTDTLPTGLTPTAATGTGWTCSISGQIVTCTRSDALAASASYAPITVTVNVASTAASSLTNTATIAGGGEVNTANDSASDPTTITPAPDLTIAKTHTGNFSQGQTGATYTLTASNAGSAATTGTVTVTDTLPTGLTPTAASGTGWSCSISAQTVTCTRSDALAASTSYPAITLTASVAANAPASITNTASVSGGGEVNTANDSASDPTTITATATSDLTITKTHTGSFTQGQTGATYTLTAKNVGSAATSSTVTVTDTLPTGLTPTAATGTGWSCTISGQAVTCTRSDALAASASYAPITVTVTVASTAASSLTNTATVAGGGEVNTANDSASDPTTITPAPDLTIAKTHTGNFSQGQTGATYTLTASNAGSAATTGAVTVTDTLPTGLTPTAASGTGWSCSISAQTVTCTRSDALAASASYAPITVTVTVASTAASSLTNTATVAGGGEVNTTNDSASDPTTITATSDLIITKTHTGSFSQGQTGATYTLTAKNVGSAATTGTVTVTDTVPTGLTPTAASGTGWSCTIAGQAVTCTRSDALAASASYAPITVNVTVASNASASITNTATVAGGGEVNTANDSASDPTTITATATPDLTITKTHTGSFSQGQTGATYTLTTKNIGSAATIGTVTVTDTLPTGLTPTAASGTGWSCTISSQTVTCTRSDALAASASYPAITLTASVAANAPASITNTATIAGGNDSNTSNNSSSDPTAIGVAGATPQIILVKRITAINGVNITTTVDDPGSSNDNVANWPTPIDSTTGISTYLRGATNGGTIKPGDILEYTIYFLSNGGAAATNINLCDLIPGNSTFVPDSFSSVPESGINLTIGSTSTNLTNVPDSDAGQFFNPGSTPSVSCSAANTNGAVVVNVVKSPAALPNATAPGTPTNSYGLIRFRAKVN